VLDVGCGCGATTLEAGRQAVTGTATGLDLSTAMLAAARRRAAEERLGSVSFVAGTPRPFRSGLAASTWPSAGSGSCSSITPEPRS
jgi:predicted TPR repeat methyltransferase